MIKKNKERQGKQSKVIRGTRRSNAVRGETRTRKPTGQDQEAAAAAEKPSGIPVIGLGGSAGSLEAFKAFFAAMPADSGAAFVVIQHLSPSHESLLAELLAQQTEMRVVQARDAMKIETNCVYVIPPNHHLVISEGVLSLTEPVKNKGIMMPVDIFFRSLAEDRQERAISIVFSGAGSDGTLGIRAVRGAGGLAIAQDPQTAQFGDMPRSAIATGLVDFVLPPDRMPDTLLNYLWHPYIRGEKQASAVEDEENRDILGDILDLINSQKGSDFKCYKDSTILRRIERRMRLNRVPNLARYYDLLRQDVDEASQLHKDLLINVTSFFRDAEAFEEFRQKVVAPLVQSKQRYEPLRAWVPGCASGEEAYSLAMLLMEEMAGAGKNFPLQIFATDIDDEALELARLGTYPEGIAIDVGAERLSRFFIRTDKGYQVTESVRESVVFANQNVITDPPFSRMDIISCRNLLIYLDADTQAKLIPLFNFALNPGGYLFLGKSEGIGGQHDLFDTVSKKARLFRRLVPARPIVLDSPILPGRKKAQLSASPIAVKPPVTAFGEAIRQALLNHFAAAVVLVDRKGQILQFHGQTGKYLTMPEAEPNLNLLAMARQGLSGKLRSSLRKAIETGMPVLLESVQITRNDRRSFVRVTISPALQRGDAEPLFAVIFEDSQRREALREEEVHAGESEEALKQLEDELTAAQQELQATIEELQASNEELRLANEEVVSTNEELQSTVEELETSKEELQSVNEELTTVNSELQEKVRKLDTANSDLTNFLESSEIATLFLDGELRIRLFTPATTRLLKLIPSDTGRPISDLSMNFINYDLVSDVSAVVRGGGVIEREVQHADGTHYLIRIMPYRNQRDQPDGVVATFSDITRIKQSERQTRRLATVLTDSNDAVLLFGPAGNILTWNRGAHSIYGWTEAEALHMTIRDMMPPGRTSEIDNLILRLLAGETVSFYETQRRAKDGRILDISLTATAVWDEAGKRVEAFATTERDITGRRRAEKEVERLNEELMLKVSELEATNKELEAFVYSVSHDLRAPLRTIAGFVKILGEDCSGQLDAQGRSYVDRIYEGAEKMSRLIEDLLYLSHISRQAINRSELNMSNKASSIIEEFRDRNPARSVEISVEEGLTAFADPGLTEIVLMNLLENAWKFTSNTEKARIEFRSFRQDGKTVYYIRDNGVGFDPDYKERLFLPFQRLHSDKEFEGIGIGLSIVARIIRRHGGQIWMEGEKGNGATVFFTLN